MSDNLQKQQILVNDLMPRMAFFLGGAIWEVVIIVVNEENGDFNIELKDPNGFVDSRIRLSLDRRLGIEIVTWDGNREFRQSDKYDGVSASDQALDELRFKLTGTRRLPEPKAQWEMNLEAGRDIHDNGAGFDCCAPDTELGQKDEEPMQLIDGAVVEQELNTIDHNPGKHLCYDDWSGRYFYGSMEFVADAVNRLNSILNAEGDACLNDFYDILGLTGLPMGVDHGWSGQQVTVTYGSMISPKGIPVICVTLRDEPKPALGMR